MQTEKIPAYFGIDLKTRVRCIAEQMCVGVGIKIHDNFERNMELLNHVESAVEGYYELFEEDGIVRTDTEIAEFAFKKFRGK